MHQSELALFSQEFQRVLGLLASAVGAARVCAAGEDDLAGRELHTGLDGLARELAALLTRAGEERASVLIFGPAKAGKSTLIEALAAASTASVSSLPSYPCLTRYAHGLAEGARLHAFDGSATSVVDPAGLALALRRAHLELAARARAVRAAGEVFDPPRHLPRALRRLERTLLAPALAQAALELIEFPSVHGPLFAGYEEMGLGEPERAAAAVFVVRAAQLADDTVFDGVEELLQRFQPLFLVLNVDARAKELGSEGELVASQEVRDPARLVAALEQLSRVGPLAEAVASARVEVFALDALAAAAARRRGVEEPSGALARFSDCEQALAETLGRHPALSAFTRSARRRATELVEEARELASTPLLEELRRRIGEIEREQARLAEGEEARARLAGRERARWEAEPFFDELRARLASATLSRARALAQELAGPLSRALEDWFASGSSLADLLEAALGPRLDAARSELARSAERVLTNLLCTPADLAERAARLAAELEPGGLVLEELLGVLREGQGALQPLDGSAAVRVLDVEAIPVKARLGQRLTWRSEAEVRRALFGPSEEPRAPLTSRTKAERLGDEGREAMRRSATERALSILEEEARAHARALGDALVTRFLAELARALERARDRAAEPGRALAARASALGAERAALEALLPTCTRASADLAALAERFSSREVLIPAPRVQPGPPARAPAPRGERV
jgi:hypothetical protein